jgi:hypothetical protein
MNRAKLLKLSLAAALCAGSLTLAGNTEAARECPRQGILCNQIYDPVICNNDQVYPNSCYAYVDCATGCKPYNNAV